MTAYADFLKSKRLVVPATGHNVPAEAIHPLLFDFQRDIVRWALRKGRAAIFADCGLGKTLMQLEWARLLGGRSLIVAPLSVARQTVGEASKIGLGIHSRGAWAQNMFYAALWGQAPAAGPARWKFEHTLTALILEDKLPEAICRAAVYVAMQPQWKWMGSNDSNQCESADGKCE